MTEFGAAFLTSIVDATWPAAAREVRDGWTFRVGAGGGQRVSAATQADRDTATLEAMEAGQSALRQPALVMVRPGEDALDSALDTAGYVVRDPTLLMVAPSADLGGDNGAVATYPLWPPLAIQREVWVSGGVGPERLAIMDRATTPKISLLGRLGDRPVATAFIATHGDFAMLHALEVTADARRSGVGTAMMRAAANWATDAGCTNFAILVVAANTGAVALYEKLGMVTVGRYHYRRLLS